MIKAAVNGRRLWDRIVEMAAIGATSDGGCNRQALTDEDRAGRDKFVSWCENAGCSIRVDQMGNIFARRSGLQNDLAPVVSGSHLDTQPTGGRFDGVYGVLAALEVVESLNDADAVTKAPIEVVVWTNEEGSRFAPAMLGSGVWSGVLDLASAHARTDSQGKTVCQELERIGYLGASACEAFNVCAAFELHIEQGPVLEREERTIGVVSGIQGLRWYELALEGQSCHAGTTPMDCRRDPVAGLSKVIQGILDLAERLGPAARVTVGSITTEPDSFNTVPERVKVKLDVRHPDTRSLDRAEDELEQIIRSKCEELSLTFHLQRVFSAAPITFDSDCVAVVQEAADDLGYSSKMMVSGAAHDSMYLARVAPTGMIFVPCEAGLSHNPAENAKLTDLEAGNNVLLHAMLRMANK